MVSIWKSYLDRLREYLDDWPPLMKRIKCVAKIEELCVQMQLTNV